MATSAVENDAVPTVENDAVPIIESDAIPTLENDAIPTLENAIPTLENDAIPTPENAAIPTPENAAIPTVKTDAIAVTFNEDTNHPEHKIDLILNKLTIDDYRSILFMFIGVEVKNKLMLNKEDYLFWVLNKRDDLKKKILNVIYEFRFKDALLIEILGTMQRYDLLKYLGTCRHIFEKDKETFTQLSSLWKFLYAVCEQLTDNEVDYLKEKLFPDENLNVCCAEELICHAFLKGKLEEKENNWKGKLADIFKTNLPECSKFVTSYKGLSLEYYPLRRPTKTAPCGIAVIMNHVKFDPPFKDRPESNLDANSLKKLWESFGFKTEIHTDLTYEEVIQVFVKLSKENHANYDAFVACYLSHGDEGSVISKDGKHIKFTDLVDLIANKCETLVGKPKLFFVQACQGSGIQTGFGGQTFINKVPTVNSQVRTSRHSTNDALRSDVLIFNSTIEGFVSYRDGTSSWFVAELVSNMEKFGEEYTITSVSNKVVDKVTGKDGVLTSNSNITKCKQTPVICSTLKYELKLKKVL